MRFFAKFLILASIAGFLFTPALSRAEEERASCAGMTGLELSKCRLERVQSEAGFETQTDPVVIVGNLIGIFLSVLGVIFLVLTVYAGYLWMTARGDEQQVTKAKDVLKAAMIGIAITLGAYAISSFVIDRLQQSTTGELDEKVFRKAR